VGVAFGQGDRNDPMDLDTVNPGGGGTTYRNRMIMILDRQDSADITNSLGQPVDTKGYGEDDLADLTSVASESDSRITMSDPLYYLKTSSGYKLHYPSGVAKPDVPNAWYYDKSVTSPVVLVGALEFSRFAPTKTAGVCSGAGGTTYTYRICNVIHPVYGSGTTAVSTTSCSGIYTTYNDIPSEIGTAGGRGSVQIGEPKAGEYGIGNTIPTVIDPPPGSLAPKPRAWRIIR
jgi:hypothetical protein